MLLFLECNKSLVMLVNICVFTQCPKCKDISRNWVTEVIATDNCSSVHLCFFSHISWCFTLQCCFYLSFDVVCSKWFINFSASNGDKHPGWTWKKKNAQGGFFFVCVHLIKRAGRQLVRMHCFSEWAHVKLLNTFLKTATVALCLWVLMRYCVFHNSSSHVWAG